MEKPGVLRPSTPGGHPAILAAWAAALVLGAAALWRPEAGLAAAVLAVAGIVAYLVRHARFVRRLDAVEAALRRGEIATARALAAPLFERYPGVPLVQKAAADVLYASGDPLSASALYERAAKRMRDAEIVVGLVASYAALNKAGDARRAAAIMPEHHDVRLALAWAELVALAGDRRRGAELADALARELEPAHGAERTAMTNALAAIAAAHRRDGVAARAALEAAERQLAALEPADVAFIGYLGGVALRELGLVGDARATFERAMAAAPETIGEALARRERSHLPGSTSSSVQPSSD